MKTNQFDREWIISIAIICLSHLIWLPAALSGEKDEYICSKEMVEVLFDWHSNGDESYISKHQFVRSNLKPDFRRKLEQAMNAKVFDLTKSKCGVRRAKYSGIAVIDDRIYLMHYLFVYENGVKIFDIEFESEILRIKDYIKEREEFIDRVANDLLTETGLDVRELLE
jgi:hypothetical protein